MLWQDGNTSTSLAVKRQKTGAAASSSRRTKKPRRGVAAAAVKSSGGGEEQSQSVISVDIMALVRELTKSKSETIQAKDQIIQLLMSRQMSEAHALAAVPNP